ncbi:MAG: tetratricopeptide repeat protein [Terriglobales bacterium]
MPQRGARRSRARARANNRGRRPGRWSAIFATLLASVSLLAAQAGVHSNVVVDSNSALFAVLAALNAAGYNQGLGGPPADTSLRRQVRAAVQAQPVPVLRQLSGYFQAHRRSDTNQDLAQYVQLALFLANPPALTLTVPPAGLPPAAATVQDVVPLLREFWDQAHLDAVWQQVQPGYAAALRQDSTLVRNTVTQVNAFFRIPQAYESRQFFIFPDAQIAAGEGDALSYQDNYYLVVNLHLAGQRSAIRHTYLHFMLDPLVAQTPAAIAPVEHSILPVVAQAPALAPEFKRDATLLWTECLVRAIEIQLDDRTAAARQSDVTAAMRQGLVLTAAWSDQLAKYSVDPASFAEFYPEAAFAIRVDEVAGAARHITFAAPIAAAAPTAPADSVQPVHAPSLLEQSQTHFDAGDFVTAGTLAQAALRQPKQRAEAYYMLGKVAAEQNHAQEAEADFLNALQQPVAPGAHVQTWTNIYLGRLYDAEHNRSAAVAHYRAAAASADTPASKKLAEDGVKAPFTPPATPHHP